jgi:hypothetical protein
MPCSIVRNVISGFQENRTQNVFCSGSAVSSVTRGPVDTVGLGAPRASGLPSAGSLTASEDSRRMANCMASGKAAFNPKRPTLALALQVKENKRNIDFHQAR